MDNGYNTGLNANWRYDMWLENAPIKNLFLGLRCINWYAGCNMDTSLILPQTTDERILRHRGHARRRKMDARHDVAELLSVSEADGSG